MAELISFRELLNEIKNASFRFHDAILNEKKIYTRFRVVIISLDFLIA